MAAKKRILSGIQPSGNSGLHLGNYLGALKTHVEMSRTKDDAIEFMGFFIADLHALTSVHDRATLKQSVKEVAATYIALGLDTDRAIFFRQSDLGAEITQLYWMLNTCTGVGLMERAPAYKEKVAKGLPASQGLFLYPMLMAADVLLFRSTHVPVGADQLIHCQIIADVATHFNSTYKPENPLTIPQPVIAEAGKVLGLDGEKMSKSYNNTIPIFAEGKELRKLIGSIKTDSRPPSESKDPESVLPYLILEPFLTPDEKTDIGTRLLEGKIGYGDLKGLLTEKVDATFKEPRERFKALMADDRGDLDTILSRGAHRAREIADFTLADCLKATGLDSAAERLLEPYYDQVE